MRTINATLTANLAAGTGKPFLKGYIGYMNGTVLHSDVVQAYKLTGTTLEFVMPYQADLASDQTAIWLERGVTVNGTDYTLTTGRFFLHDQTYLPGGRQLARGGIFPREYYSLAAYATYQTVINNWCTHFGKTAVYREPGDAWLAYKFYGSGQNLTLADAMQFLNVLQQKRMISLCDKGSEEILVYCADTLGAKDLDITCKDLWEVHLSKNFKRQYIWKDEVGTVHQAGTTTDPVHNLGYLESTAAAPGRYASSLLAKAIIRPDFRIIDGDRVRFIMPNGSTATVFAQVTEEFNPNLSKEPRWRMTVEANPIFNNTEGGNVPPSVALTANLAALNVSRFDGELSSNDNNIQMAFDTLDNHVHTAKDMLSTAFLANQQVPPAAYYYAQPFSDALAAGALFMGIPHPGTIRNLGVGIITPQPVGNVLIFTVRKNGVNTALTVTVPSGGAAGAYSDITHSFTVVAGDYIDIAIGNFHPTLASAVIRSIVLTFETQVT